MPTKLALLVTAAAASIATAAVIALPAVGDDGPDTPAGKQRVAVEGPGPTALRTCLKGKGLDPPDDDAALKQWIGGQISAGKGDEIKGCFISIDGKKPDDGAGTAQAPAKPKGDDRPGPSWTAMRTCLKDRGFDVPDDPMGLKEWLRPHMNSGDAADKAGQACFQSLPPKPPSEYGPSEKKRFGDGG